MAKTLTPKEQAQMLLEIMTKGNARIYCVNQQKKGGLMNKFWNDVKNSLDEITTP